jgi:hypothetical protein
MTSNYIWYYGTPRECVASEEGFGRVRKDINHEFAKDGRKIQYSLMYVVA